ncbi:hypothetical protein [Vannielia litorea]|uniref:Uncharacterized protein n=1 Tax=Vannielia litorea TaxID=1217970 RepID=A0A1N6F8S6_9RHOB|nr:hypothetical protein [Vannielia litorea]SIN91708.1 hypothetical protein SAMN05444002_1476 [Vannielia litorea]
MAWKQLFENWADALPKITALYPHVDAVALQRFRGNRSLFVAYLAATHDLTLREAEEGVDDMLMRFGRCAMTRPEAA